MKALSVKCTKFLRACSFPVEFEKGEDPHVLMTGTWNTTAPASLVLSPNADVLVIAHGSSISFYSTITGVLDTTIEDIFLGKIIIQSLPLQKSNLILEGSD